MSSTNPTLINGFEDVMTHIKKLEQENKKLKEKLERVTNVRDDFVHTCASLNTALQIIGGEVEQDISKEEIDEEVDDRGELDNDKLLKILYEFFNVDED